MIENMTKSSMLHNHLRGYWTILLTITSFLIVLFMFASKCYRANDQHFVYTLDDPYIHMAIAKNLVLYGNWGVTPEYFSSSSSSLGWTLLLAGYYFLFGISEFAPFFLNGIAAIGCLWYVFQFGQKYHLHPIHNLITQIVFVLFVPLIPVIFTGMEHTLHIFLMLMLIYQVLEVFSQNMMRGELLSIKTISFLMTASLVVMIRYESLFLLGMLIGVAIWRKRYLLGISIAIFSLAPVIIFGLISLVHHHYFLPNTLMVKGHFPNVTSLKSIIYSFGYASLKILSTQNTHLLVLIIVTLLIYIIRYNIFSYNESRQYLLIGIVIVSLLHGQFASTGWFYRYEAYIMALGIVAISISLDELIKQKLTILQSYHNKLESIPKILSIVLLLIFCILPLSTRGNLALRLILPATKNIYEQQYQMGRFFTRYYRTASIAANDIGAISFFATPSYLLDFWGLGSIELTRAIRNQKERKQLVAKLAREHHVQFAVVYADQVKSIPKEWIKIGTWTIQNNVVCAGNTVTFFVVDFNKIAYALQALREFSKDLPPSVIEGGWYVADKEFLRWVFNSPQL